MSLEEPSDIHAMQHADNLIYTLVLFLSTLRCEIKRYLLMPIFNPHCISKTSVPNNGGYVDSIRQLYFTDNFTKPYSHEVMNIF